jgi:hypothetical protein
MDVLRRGFDSMEFISEVIVDKGVKIYRVMAVEVPIEDILICPEIIKLDGVDPFIIKYNYS